MTTLCQCGCGKSAPIHSRNNAARGYVKGEARSYRRGHQPKRRGDRHPQWNGGRRGTANGYIEVRTPGHPRAHNGYVAEHVLVAERALGKFLEGKHPVHHVDDNGENNTNTNLVVCEDLAYHRLLHQRQRALDACGDPNAIACQYCGGYEGQDELRQRGYHTACRRERRSSRRSVQ